MEHTSSHTPADGPEENMVQPEQHGAQHSPLRTYYTVYGALLALMVLTVLAAQFDWGTFGIVVAMAIAVTKAMLVLIYFMHLRQSSRLTWLFAGAGFAWLALMIVGIVSDYISRSWVGE